MRSAGGEVHVLDELGRDELGIGAYALAPEFNGRAWHWLTWKTKKGGVFHYFRRKHSMGLSADSMRRVLCCRGKTAQSPHQRLLWPLVRRALGKVSLPCVPSAETRSRIRTAATVLPVMMQERAFLVWPGPGSVVEGALQIPG